MRARLSVWLGLSLAGVLSGHWLGYALLVPDAGARRSLLESTGHHYLGVAAVVAFVFAIATALAATRRGYLRGLDAEMTRRRGPIFAGLLGFQLAIFATIEVVERAVAASGFEGMISFLALGAAIQAVTAAAGALVVRAAEAAGEAIGRSLAPLVASRAISAERVPAEILFVRGSRPAPCEVRGPPVMSFV